MLQFKDNFLFTKKPKIYGFFSFENSVASWIHKLNRTKYWPTRRVIFVQSKHKNIWVDVSTCRICSWIDQPSFFLEIQNISDLLKMMPYHCLRLWMIRMKFHFMFSYDTPYRIESIEGSFVWHSSYFMTFAIITSHR